MKYFFNLWARILFSAPPKKENYLDDNQDQKNKLKSIAKSILNHERLLDTDAISKIMCQAGGEEAALFLKSVSTHSFCSDPLFLKLFHDVASNTRTEGKKAGYLLEAADNALKKQPPLFIRPDLLIAWVQECLTNPPEDDPPFHRNQALSVCTQAVYVGALRNANDIQAVILLAQAFAVAGGGDLNEGIEKLQSMALEKDLIRPVEGHGDVSPS